MNHLQSFTSSFWSEDFWLPPKTTWKDVEPRVFLSHTDYRHLIIPLPLAMVLLALRYLLKRFCFAPLGLLMGVRKRKKNAPNLNLEKAYAALGKRLLTPDEISGLAKKQDLTEREIERWLRIRMTSDRPSKIVKFSEVSWLLFYYCASFILGLICLWDKEWFWDINKCYDNYPHQGVTQDVWLYYMLTLSFYWSLTVSQFFDEEAKYFLPMFVHHLLSITLLTVSWVCNFHRIGSLIIILHDCAEVLLQAAKCFAYARYKATADLFFVLFTVMWIATRYVIFPFWIVASGWKDAPKRVQMFPALCLLNKLLVAVLLLHVFWIYYLIKMVYCSVTATSTEDPRSSSSEDVTDS